uniref:Uncharacterized protein n=1 Tax=Caenorhabditis japonica TaxID=281687 RepID=A0A8R1E659_CAEJA
MMRRKKSSSSRPPRRRRGDSPSPPRRRSPEVVEAPPEFQGYDYEINSAYMVKAIKGQFYPFLSTGFVNMVHEMEAMMSKNCFTKEFMSGEMQFMNEGYYPTPDLNARLMPQYEMMIEGRSSDSPLENKYTDTKVNAREVSVQNEEEKEVEICLLPEEVEEDDFDEWPAYHMGTRFWAWCRRSFMGKVDTEYLENFKEMILDAYNQEALQKFFVNEPWKYRKKAPPPSSRRRSLNTPSSKSAKRVSIANETLSPQPTTSSVRLANKKA